MKLFRGRDRQEVVGILDVGNGSIGASLVRLDRNGSPEILSSWRTQLKMQEFRTNELLLSQIWKELPGVLDNLRTAALLYRDPATSMLRPQKVAHVLFLLSAPWISVSSIRTLRFSRSAPFQVTEDLLQKMLSDELRLEQKEGHEEGFETVERTIVGLRLNGYPVSALPSSAVKTAEVTFFTAAAASDMKEGLADAAHHVFPDAEQSFHSSPLSAYHGIATLYPSLSSYLFVNVTGEVTEILHVEDGAPVAFGTFPAGRNLLLRTLEANSIPVHEALSALRLSKEESSRFNSSLRETLMHAEEGWRAKLREALSTIVPTGAFPSTVLVISDLKVDQWFADALVREEFLSVSRGNAPAVRILPPSEFSARLYFHSGTPDSLVFLTALFADARFDERKTIDLLSTKMPLGMPVRATLKA